MRARRGTTYAELLVAALLLSLAGLGAGLGWSLGPRAAVSRRLTEMGTFLAGRELERLKAQRYPGLRETTPSSPSISYYDAAGAPTEQPDPRGYAALAWVRTVVDRDGVRNTEDLVELIVEIRSGDRKTLFERGRTLLSYGGL